MPYYSVHKGYKSGIFSSWDECQKNVLGFSGAIYKKFNNKKDAEYFLQYGKISQENMKTLDNFIIKHKNTTKLEKITVYTDGACYNNGFPNAVAGIGIYFGENDKRNVSRKINGNVTNNIAELTAILEVSTILSEEIKSGIDIEICTDSIYSIKCCTSYGEKQEKNNWKKDIPNKELVKEIYNTYKNYSNISFRHIKAHTGNKDIDSINNAHADRLANEAININEVINKNIYFDFPYKYKEKIEALGGRWDNNKNKWYITNPKINEDKYLFTDKESKRIIKLFYHLTFKGAKNID